MTKQRVGRRRAHQYSSSDVAFWRKRDTNGYRRRVEDRPRSASWSLPRRADCRRCNSWSARKVLARFVTGQLGERIGAAGVDAENPPERAKGFVAETVCLGFATNRWRVPVTIDHAQRTLDRLLECEQFLVGRVLGLVGDRVVESRHGQLAEERRGTRLPEGRSRGDLRRTESWEGFLRSAFPGCFHLVRAPRLAFLSALFLLLAPVRFG